MLATIYFHSGFHPLVWQATNAAAPLSSSVAEIASSCNVISYCHTAGGDIIQHYSWLAFSLQIRQLSHKWCEIRWLHQGDIHYV